MRSTTGASAPACAAHSADTYSTLEVMSFPQMAVARQAPSVCLWGWSRRESLVGPLPRSVIFRDSPQPAKSHGSATCVLSVIEAS